MTSLVTSHNDKSPRKALDLTECNFPALQCAPDSCSAGPAIKVLTVYKSYRWYYLDRRP